ncbi:HOOK family protein [Methylobacterium sp. E-065]|uniref:HOOK family protein n=1 Tax=Methylobacterium sp. E-065 TaxID=2836583 RepID=UPI001FBAD4EE|nr:HOOK family protein [Methylobacterium sp. E-065]MCJ2017977.1 HOOK family protein [Methylobacterium sp. E-065]
MRVLQDSVDVRASFSLSGHRRRDAALKSESCMAQTLELDGLNELHAALIEERQIIVASVRKLRETRRQKGSFVLGDGSEAGPRFVAVQQQIDVIEAVIATLTGSQA